MTASTSISPSDIFAYRLACGIRGGVGGLKLWARDRNAGERVFSGVVVVIFLVAPLAWQVEGGGPLTAPEFY